MDPRQRAKLAQFKEQMESRETESPANTLSSETLDYQEHMTERHKDAGHKINQTIVAEKQDASERPSQLNDNQSDQGRHQEASRVSWKEKHPELFQEMVDNNVPLDAEQFKKEGYRFSRAKDGTMSVLYPTKEYTEWLQGNQNPENYPPNHYETLAEKQARENRIKQTEDESKSQRKLQEQIQKEADEQGHKEAEGVRERRERFYAEQQTKRTKEANERLEKSSTEKAKETRHRNRLKRLGIEESDVEQLYSEMFPNSGFPLSSRERENIVLLADRHLKERRDYLSTASSEYIYKKACAAEMMKELNDGDVSEGGSASSELFSDAFYDRLDVRYPVKNVNQAYSRRHGYYGYDPKYSSSEIDVAERILDTQQRVLFAEKIEEKFSNLSPEEKDDCKRGALTALVGGGLLGLKLSERKGQLDELFEKTGLDKNSLSLSTIVEGHHYLKGHVKDPDRSMEEFAEYFNLGSRINENIANPNSGLEWSHGKLSLKMQNGGWIDIDIDIDSQTQEKIEQSRQGIISDFERELESSGILEKGFSKKKKEFNDSVSRRVSDWQPGENLGFLEDISHLQSSRLDLYKLPEEDYSLERRLKSRLESKMQESELGHLFVGLFYAIDWDVEVDGAGALREALTHRLAKGIRAEKSGEISYLTDIFETEEFKANQDDIGLDFESSEVFQAGFEGFINTIASTKGELSAQVDWYCDNIFIHDPEKFLSQLKAYQGSAECSRGLKAKIGRFLNRSDMIAEFYRQQQLKQDSEMMMRQVEIENADKQPIEPTDITKEDIEAIIAPEVSILRKADQNDVLSLVRRRQEELVTAIEDMGAEKVRTFPFVKEFPVEGGEAEYSTRSNGQRPPIDFGIEKVETEMKYYNFVKENIPDSNPQWFIDSFPGEDRIVENPENRFDGVKLDSPRSYIGFSFEYEGKLCVVAESFGDPAAMYLFCGEPGSNFKRMFDMSKLDARMDANVATVNHLDKQHIDEDLDASYQRAFMFFRTGDKSSVYYGPIGTRSEWEARQDETFPAWPLGVTGDYGEYGDDIERYRAWQANQMNSRPNAVL